MNKIYVADAISALQLIDDSSIDLVYIDPPFGTNVTQKSCHIDASGKIIEYSYRDKYEDYVEFIVPHLVALHRVLKPTGSMYVHLDYRWVHYVKVELDKIFGHDNFLNEVIWSYNFGGRGKDRWPAKHDTLLVYVKARGKHTFNWDSIPRIPYKAPGVQSIGRTPEEAAARVVLGQVPTDVWDIGIIGTNSRERVGYPSQKPTKLLENVVLASSNVGDVVLDAFAGSGTTGIVALRHRREFVMIDKNPDAIKIMQQRVSSEDANCVFELVTVI